MSDRDERVEAAAEAIWMRQAWRHHTPWEDLDREVRDEFLADARAALAAADAVQRGESRSLLRKTAAQSGTCPICHTPFGPPAARRRMVDLDAAAGWIADNVPGVGHAQKFRIEFGGSAPSEEGEDRAV